MRTLDIAFASMVLRFAPARPPRPQRRVAPAIDGADAATLDRGVLPQDRAALIASLWPAPLRQCVVPAKFMLHGGPVELGCLWLVSRPPKTAPEVQPPLARAA